jgi:hypothetical protein
VVPTFKSTSFFFYITFGLGKAAIFVGCLSHSLPDPASPHIYCTNREAIKMGGKTWSMEEERFFWQVIVPQSPQAVAESDRRQSWESCAAIMQREMGKKRLRDYTRTMLCTYLRRDNREITH